MLVFIYVFAFCFGRVSKQQRCSLLVTQHIDGKPQSFPGKILSKWWIWFCLVRPECAIIQVQVVCFLIFRATLCCPIFWKLVGYNVVDVVNRCELMIVILLLAEMVVSTIIYRVSYMSGAAGFLPSTVWSNHLIPGSSSRDLIWTHKGSPFQGWKRDLNHLKNLRKWSNCYKNPDNWQLSR